MFLTSPGGSIVWGMGIEDAFLRADGFELEGYLRAPSEWVPQGPNSIWELRYPAYGLNDALTAPRRPLSWYLLRNNDPLSLVVLC